MEIKNISNSQDCWQIQTVEFWDGTDFKLIISTQHRGYRRRCIKRLIRVHDKGEELVAESHINEIDLNGHEYSSFNPKNYIHKELFNNGYLEKADFRNYESKED